MDDCSEFHKALLKSRNVQEFLHEIAGLAVREIATGLSCGMTMQPNGRPATVACTDPVAAEVDRVQYRLDDGPCLHAMRNGDVVRIGDTAEPGRWPAFQSAAAEAGIRSCLAVPLEGPSTPVSSTPVGAINLYARNAEAFSDAEIERAAEFAGEASGALAVAERIASFADLNEQLRASLASRSVIDVALGIVIARERCTQPRAFEILRVASQNTNTKLRDLAARLVTSVTGEPLQAAPPFDDPSAAATLG